MTKALKTRMSSGLKRLEGYSVDKREKRTQGNPLSEVSLQEQLCSERQRGNAKMDSRKKSASDMESRSPGGLPGSDTSCLGRC